MEEEQRVPETAEAAGEDLEEYAAGETEGAADAAGDRQTFIQRDIQSFMREFPGVSAEGIAQEVWDGVGEGKTLTESYRAWQGRQLERENRRLRLELEAGRVNARNRERSVGTQRSDGSGRERDAFAAALLGED